jgi:hypothetical protein
MKTIELTQGYTCTVDDADYELVSKMKWAITNHGRAGKCIGSSTTPSGKTTILMHRFILGITDTNVFVDHIDRNPLNNCRSNLRIANQNQNQHNRRANLVGTSIYKGVSKQKNVKKYKAQIMAENKLIYIGMFSSEIEAAKAYDEMAKKLHGEFACLNFPN